MKCPLVQCPCCKGTGKSKLTTPLFDVLKVVTNTWQSTKAIYGQIPNEGWFKITAINNRLVLLQGLDLIDCEQRGKAKFWKLKR